MDLIRPEDAYASDPLPGVSGSERQCPDEFILVDARSSAWFVVSWLRPVSTRLDRGWLADVIQPCRELELKIQSKVQPGSSQVPQLPGLVKLKRRVLRNPVAGETGARLATAIQLQHVAITRPSREQERV